MTLPERRLRRAAYALSIPLILSVGNLANAQSGFGGRTTGATSATAVCGNMAYISNSYDHTLTAIDLSQERVVATIKTGTGPINPTFNRDWTRLYVSNSQDGTLTVLDTKTQKVLKTISAGRAHPSGLRFLPSGNLLVISYMGDRPENGSPGPGSLGIMDLSTGKIIRSIPVEVGSERFDITPDGKKAYVANLGSGSISVVDLEAGKVVDTIQSPEKGPFNVLVSPKGLRAYVAHGLGNSIVEIDTVTDKVLSTIRTAPGPNGMTFTPDGDNILFTTSLAGRMQAYNLSGKVVNEGKPIGLFPGHLRITSDGFKGIFVRPYGRSVALFDPRNMEVTKEIETGTGPTTVAICGNL